MCGIFGVLRFDGNDVPSHLLEGMRDRIIHRGPDEYGQHVDGPFGFGNVRLSIIDLKTGKQPIFNEDNNLAIIYNGEIYNFKQLRAELNNHRFVTQTDTEVVLHAYEEWGLACLPKFNGMFAFAIWDRTKNELLIARDRIGIKPLYYVHEPNYFAFSSEIKALHYSGLYKPKVDTRAMHTYLNLKYVPDDSTLFQNVRRLLPGEFMRVRANGSAQIDKFWTFKFNPDMEGRPETEYVAELSQLFQNAVKDQLVADVPVGAFLSGGIDSSAVVSEMARYVKELHTFTVDFGSEGKDNNESVLARVFARKIGAAHEIVSCDARQWQQLLPLSVYHLDEPVSEPLMAVNYLLAQAGSKKVKVMLSGEGADELFAGYPRYKMSYFLHALSLVPRSIRRLAYDLAISFWGEQDLKTKILNMSLTPRECINWHTVFMPREISALTGVATIEDDWTREWVSRYDGSSLLDFMLEVDTRFRLPEYILNRVDKMTMANSLELRPPILDNRIVDFALKLPARFKINGKQDKYIFRRMANGIVPSEVAKRKKKVFSAPYEKWLPGLGEKYLRTSHCACAGLLNQEELNRLLAWNHFYRGRWAEKVWTIIVLEVWYRIFISRTLDYKTDCDFMA